MTEASICSFSVKHKAPVRVTNANRGQNPSQPMLRQKVQTRKLIVRQVGCEIKDFFYHEHY